MTRQRQLEAEAEVTVWHSAEPVSTDRLADDENCVSVLMEMCLLIQSAKQVLPQPLIYLHSPSCD